MMPQTEKESKDLSTAVPITAGKKRRHNAVPTVTEKSLETEGLSPMSANHEAERSASMENAEADDHEDDGADPSSDGLGQVVAEYDMYLNKPGKRIMLLQYPNRDPGQSYSDKTGQKPLELRIKPKCGLVEVDVPLSIHANFDKQKGIHYGEAMRKSRTLQEGGSYGLSGGLRTGIGPTGPRRNRSRIDEQASMVEEPSPEDLIDNFEDANEKGHVMNKIILGGRIIPWKDGDPIYMVGVFRGMTTNVAENVFLNKLDAMVQLRPQFDHLDALGELEKPVMNPKSKAGVENLTEEPQARAVNMTAKSADVEEMDLYGDMSETARLLRAMREEPWQRLAWVDSEDDRSYRVFNDELFIQDPAGAPPLISAMTDEQWLDAISCPRIDPINQGKRIMTRQDTDSDSSFDTDSSDADG